MLAFVAKTSQLWKTVQQFLFNIVVIFLVPPLHPLVATPSSALCVGHVVTVPQPGSKMGPSVPCQLLRAAFMLFTSPPWQVAVRAHAQVAEQLQ